MSKTFFPMKNVDFSQQGEIVKKVRRRFSHYVKSPIFVPKVDFGKIYFEFLISVKIQVTLICRKYVTLTSVFDGNSCQKTRF